MKRVFNWWNSMKPENRRLFDVGVLCSPFHLGLGLTLFLQQPLVMGVFCIPAIFFILLSWKYSR